MRDTRWFTYHCIGLGWLLAGALAYAQPHGTHAQLGDAPAHRLSCDVTYAGHTQTVVAVVTREPYQVKAQSIGGRFLFKAMQVQTHAHTQRLSVYVYRQDGPQAVLIQHVQRQPPYPVPPPRGRVDLWGEQRLYSGELERELIYTCHLADDAP